MCKRTSWRIRDLDNHAYKIIHKSVKWQEARLGCESLGGHLATTFDGDELWQSWIPWGTLHTG